MFDLDRHAFRLLKDEPFFSAISRNVSKIQNRSIPTAGVTVNKTTHFFELHYNPDFFESLGKTDFYGKELEGDAQLERRDTEIRAILKHEFYHLIFNHLTERLPDGEMTMLWNVAADLAINSEIGTELSISFMSQYRPSHKAKKIKPLSIPLSEKEYLEAVNFLYCFGFENGWIQDWEPLDKSFVPDFEKEGSWN